jgi:hypothetical protein
MFRRLSLFVLEILPWALASLIGLFLLAGHLASPGRADVKAAAPLAAVVLAATNDLSR